MCGTLNAEKERRQAYAPNKIQNTPAAWHLEYRHRGLRGDDGVPVTPPTRLTRCAEHRLGPNGLKFEKETSHDILSWTRRASMA